MNSELLALQAPSAATSALDPACRTELTEAAVNSRLTRPLARRYAPQAAAVTAFLRPIAAGYRTRAADATSERERYWFEQHAAHVETWLARLAAMKHRSAAG